MPPPMVSPTSLCIFANVGEVDAVGTRTYADTAAALLAYARSPSSWARMLALTDASASIASCVVSENVSDPSLGSEGMIMVGANESGQVAPPVDVQVADCRDWCPPSTLSSVTLSAAS